MKRTEERFQFEENTYTKVYDPKLAGYTFFLNGNKIDIYEWNKAVNRYQPMTHKITHPNFLVRFIETQRHSITCNLAAVDGSTFILDIGCESGNITSKLPHETHHVILLDVDQEALRPIKKNVEHSFVSCLVADVYGLPFAGRSVDRILCTEVLEHLVDPEKAVREIERILKPGGRVVVSVPNDRLILWMKKKIIELGFTRVLGKLSPGLAMGHLHLFNRISLTSLFNRNLKVTQCFYNFPWFTNIFLVAEKK